METAVIICNLSVLVAAIYRFRHKTEIEEPTDSKTPLADLSSSRSRRSRGLPSNHPFVLGPPLAVAAGGLTTGGPLGVAGVDGGIKVQTETVRWAHSGDFYQKDANILGRNLQSQPSFDIDDSEDDKSALDASGKRMHHGLDRDLELGEVYRMNDLSRPAPTLDLTKPKFDSSSSKDNDRR